MSRIVYWVADSTACGFYRCRLPGSALEAKGHNVIFSEGVDLNRDPLPGSITEDDIRSCDVLVGQRIGKPGPSKLWQSLARAPGRSHLMVYELDDDVFALCEDLTNPNHVFWPDLIVDVVKNLACADVVTVSTAPLAEVVSRFTNAPVYAIPNAIGQSLIDSALEPRVKPNTLGWSGSPTHDGDWSHANTTRWVERWLTNKVGEGWRLATIGVPPAPVEQLFRASAAEWEIIPPNRDIAIYYSLLRMNFDIGLAPLAPTRFNASKSDLRLLELAALGIPWIASNVGPYGRRQECQGGAYVSRPREWWSRLRWLAENSDARDAMSAAGQAWARTRTVERVLPLWESAFELKEGTVPDQA